MSRTDYTGPLVAFGVAASPNNAGETNQDFGPSLLSCGLGLLDGRFYTGRNAKAYGWGPGVSAIPTIDEVPSAAATANIAALANVTNGTAMTLVNASGSGITVGVSILNAATMAAVAGLLAIDVKGGGPIAAGVVAFGQSAEINLYDPTKAIARAVSITGAASATGGHFIVKGYDVYGYPMSENINQGGAVTTNGKKAFKYIASVTPQFTDAHNYSVGTADVYGLPLRADSYAELLVYFGDPATPANNLVTAATGFVKADTTSPATTTTGDPRGTITATSDGTKRLSVLQTPWPANLATMNPGLVGVVPV